MTIRNTFTDEELRARAMAMLIGLGAENSPYRYLSITVERNKPDEVLLEFTNMYEAPCKCDDALLDATRELVGADHAEHYDDISEVGCETCDYGSRYGFAVRCW